MQSFLVKFFKYGNSGVSKYLNDLVKNTVYLRIDDRLIMVLDISSEQKQKILNLLETMRKKNKIFYGTHASNSALITCIVKSAEDHIHFVDEGSGGFALAEEQLNLMSI